MSYYNNVYKRRLNRYGTDYQSRIQAQREKEFEGKLLKSVYRIDFKYDNQIHPATLEKYKQDESQLMQYLLTRADLDIPNGTILMIEDKNLEEQPWMVFWLESLKASGYNRYIVLKMTHYIKWRDRDDQIRETWCYFHGSGDSALKETVKATGAIYVEDSNARFAVMPLNENLSKDDYIEIGEGKLKEAFRVTGYDIHSTQGVEYVTLDPMYIKDSTPAPEKTPEDSNEVFFWLNGGVE